METVREPLVVLDSGLHVVTANRSFYAAFQISAEEVEKREIFDLAGGAWNILLAAELIEHGHVEAAVAGGAESADPHFHAGFDAMRAFNGQDNERPERASRPYAADRAGFVFGEGAGIVVLETARHAEARGAEVLGVVRGYGMSSDGTGEMVFPSEEGAFLAMQRALRHAGADAGEIDYVNTHGTSTVLGDAAEVRALRRIFGSRRVPYSSRTDISSEKSRSQRSRFSVESIGRSRRATNNGSI